MRNRLTETLYFTVDWSQNGYGNEPCRSEEIYKRKTIYYYLLNNNRMKLITIVSHMRLYECNVRLLKQLTDSGNGRSWS